MKDAVVPGGLIIASARMIPPPAVVYRFCLFKLSSTGEPRRDHYFEHHKIRHNSSRTDAVFRGGFDCVHDAIVSFPNTRLTRITLSLNMSCVNPRESYDCG